MRKGGESQHRLLRQQINRLQVMVAAVEHAMEAQKMGIALTPEERFEIFGDFVPEDYAEEVEQRWGGTQEYQQSQRRVAAHDKQAWLRIKAEGADIEQRFVAALNSGVAADSHQAMDLAEESRQHITRWFYDCGYDIHRGLGDLFVDDARFRARYEAIIPGLAQFVRDAHHANANRAAS